MFRFPWKIHGVARGAPPFDLLVQIEHTHLLALYEGALDDLRLKIALTDPPKYSTDELFVEYQGWQRDVLHYEEAISWLSQLKSA